MIAPPSREPVTAAAVELLQDLIARPSVTPDDAGCQEQIAIRLRKLGFDCETVQAEDVTNLWARKGNRSPVVCFAGHTDVVPPGDEAAWRTPPFEPCESGGNIYGRGAADMKGGLAAMTVAVEYFLGARPDTGGSIAFLLTSDEEGPARDGTRKVIDMLEKRTEKIDFALVGEPSSKARVGDVIRIGRRGSLSARLRVSGVQGHAAYPELADNPVHRAQPMLAELCARQWDTGNARFPPTTFQIVNMAAGTGAPNVTPPALDIEFNFRYSTEWTRESLSREVVAPLDAHALDYRIDWVPYGEPFLTESGKLIDAVTSAITAETGAPPELSTGGGTSDGRFIAPTGAQVVELGLINASIHQVNEHTAIDDLGTLARIYTRILAELLPAGCD